MTERLSYPNKEIIVHYHLFEYNNSNIPVLPVEFIGYKTELEEGGDQHLPLISGIDVHSKHVAAHVAKMYELSLHSSHICALKAEKTPHLYSVRESPLVYTPSEFELFLSNLGYPVDLSKTFTERLPVGSHFSFQTALHQIGLSLGLVVRNDFEGAKPWLMRMLIAPNPVFDKQ